MRTAMNRFMDTLTGVSARAGIVHVTAAVTIATHQKNVKITSSGAGAYAVAFPAPEEVPGEFFFVDFVSKTTDNVTLTAVDRGSNVVLDATGEHVLLMSTGQEYIVPYAIGPSIS